MGYYTDYCLKIEKLKNDTPLSKDKKLLLIKKAKTIEEVQEILNINMLTPSDVFILFCNHKCSQGYFDKSSNTASGKWYDHEKCMLEFSQLYPNFLFTLEGKGEEDDDIWKKYFVNGMVQIEYAEIQIAPFDESKLTTPN
jgi:hypothetical protein